MDQAAYQLLVVLVVLSGLLCAFLSGLLFLWLCSFRIFLLCQHGASDIFKLIRLTWRGEASKKSLLLDVFLLGVVWFFGASILLSLLAGFTYPIAWLAVGLGGMGGYLLLRIPATGTNIASSSRINTDRLVFITVYTCCCVACIHKYYGITPLHGFTIYKHLCLAIVLGRLASHVTVENVRGRTLALLSFCYWVYCVWRERTDVLSLSLMVGLNVGLGVMVNRGVTLRTDLFTVLVCVVFSWTVCLFYTHMVFVNTNIIAQLPVWKKMEILCVPAVQFYVVWDFTRRFLHERGFSAPYLLHVIGGAWVALLLLLCKLVFVGGVDDAH